MRGDIFAFEKIPPHQPRLQASSSSTVRIRIRSIGKMLRRPWCSVCTLRLYVWNVSDIVAMLRKIPILNKSVNEKKDNNKKKNVRLQCSAGGTHNNCFRQKEQWIVIYNGPNYVQGHILRGVFQYTFAVFLDSFSSWLPHQPTNAKFHRGTFNSQLSSAVSPRKSKAKTPPEDRGECAQLKRILHPGPLLCARQCWTPLPILEACQ